MLFTWRRSPFFVQMPSFDAPGDPGGGGGELQDPNAHPDYDFDLDAGDGTNDDPLQVPNPGAPAAPPVQDPRAPGAPGQDPRTPDPAFVAYQQQTQQNMAYLQQQNERLMRTVASLTGQQQPPGPAAPVADPMANFSPQDRAAVEAIYRLLPGLKPLLERGTDLLGVPDAIAQIRQGEEGRWADIGTRMWQTFDTELRTVFGIEANQAMEPFAQKAIDAAFVNWLETDKNAQARYRMGDVTLAKEFLTNYQQGIIAPAAAARARQTPPAPIPGRPGAPITPGAPGAPRRPAQPPRVPRGGPGAAPVTQRPAQPNAQSPDQLHDAAADQFFAQR
jgi:hypothetical protein